MAITKVQQSSLMTMLFSTGNWSPSSTSLSGVQSRNLIVSMGGWWDAVNGGSGLTALPTDTNGTFSASGNARPNNPGVPTPVPGWPVVPQMGHQLSANAGSHTITPFNVGPGGGDGYFVAAEFSGGSAGTWTLVDSGNQWVGSGTAGAIDTVTVNTAGSLAAVGDLVVSICSTDGDPTAFGLSNPSNLSWNNIATTSTTTNNIGFGAAWRLATVAGTQSATWDTPDTACEMSFAAIAVFRFTPDYVPTNDVDNSQRSKRRHNQGGMRLLNDIREWW